MAAATVTAEGVGSTSPEEIADFFVFLYSDRAANSVGSTYVVDGSWLGVVI